MDSLHLDGERWSSIADLWCQASFSAAPEPRLLCVRASRRTLRREPQRLPPCHDTTAASAAANLHPQQRRLDDEVVPEKQTDEAAHPLDVRRSRAVDRIPRLRLISLVDERGGAGELRLLLPKLDPGRLTRHLKLRLRRLQVFLEHHPHVVLQHGVGHREPDRSDAMLEVLDAKFSEG